MLYRIVFTFRPKEDAQLSFKDGLALPDEQDTQGFLTTH